MSLRASVADWLTCAAANARLPPPPVLMDDLPDGGMTNEQVRDPDWRPRDVGSTRAERVNVGFVDQWRLLRSHDEEAYHAGPAHAAALVACFAAHHNGLARRLDSGLVPLLSQTPDAGFVGDAVDASLDAALECSPRLRAVARHFTTSMLPPQVAVTSFNWRSVPHVMALQAWQSKLEQQMRTSYTQLTGALDTLSTVLPPGTGLHPRDHGVFPARTGQPAPPTAHGAPPAPPPPPPGQGSEEDASTSTSSEQSSDTD